MLKSNRVSDTCSECHDLEDLAPVPELAHTPVREGSCEKCHDPHGSGRKNLLVASGTDLCWSCHQDLKAEQKRTHVHQPFARGECIECHTPHGGNAAMALRDEPRVLCARCHDVDAALAAKHKGFPLEDADCTSCHSPHASDAPALARSQVHKPYGDGRCSACHTSGIALKAAEPDLCYTCHPGMREDMKLKVPHAPLANEKACTQCHNPHTSQRAPLLAGSQERVCGTCHEDKVDSIEHEAYSHPEQNGKPCTACHDPHGYENGGTPFELVRGSCLKCHTHRQHGDHPMGADVLDPRTSKPMLCTSCHEAHGSEYPKFMSDDPSGRLCVQCHTGMIRQKK
jgi:predicted CXXCH cytochrome family protein